MADDGELEFIKLDDYKLFLDKTTVLYGQSKTGKSTILIHILHTLKPHIDQIVVFSPSDRVNKTFSKGIVPIPLIHYDVDVRLLKDIWDRQEVMGAVYQQANDIRVLKKLFDRLNLPHVRAKIAEAERARDSTIASIKQQYVDSGIVEAKVNAVDEKFNELLLVIYKRFISENSEVLRRGASKAELFVLDHLGFNPRIVVVFDDCTAMLEDKEIKNSKVFKDFFTRGRWAYMTILFGIHNDKVLTPQIRGGAFVNIFTHRPAALGYFCTKSNQFDPETIKRAKEATQYIQAPEEGHMRMAWVRESNKFFKLQAKIFPTFCFCSAPVEKYCERIKDSADGGISADSSNPFFSKFFSTAKPP